MNAFIIFILFLLNILTIFSVIILFLRQNRLTAAERNQKEALKEIEELMSAFIMEMKEENELLLKKLHRPVPHERQETAAKATSRPSPAKAPTPPEKNINDPAVGIISKRAAASAYQNRKSLDETDTVGYEPARLTERPDKVDVTSTAAEADTNSLKETLNKASDSSPQSLKQDIYEMRDQGMTIDEIAKRLNRGKTEIELLLKFRV